MKKLSVLFIIAFFVVAVIFVTCKTTMTTNYDSEALLALPGFGLGINIGNTLDAIGTDSWHAKETGWGNPMITKEYIQALKKHGYKTIRLPVTWAEYIGPAPNYIIGDCVFNNCRTCPNRMDRVEQVVNWILEEDMYCILNLHHDGGTSDKSWILNMSTNEIETLRMFETVWQQIAVRFRDTSDKLILEAMNEVGFDDLWNRWGNDQSGKPESFRKVNALNQSFVNTVRATGGNNSNRQLLVCGYWTDIEVTCDPLFVMPRDTVADRLILSLHYYTPPQFCIAEDPDTSWGFRKDWGSKNTIDADNKELIQKFEMIKTNFLNKGIPVILGEYGATKKNKVEAGRIRWMIAVTQICLDYGICPVLWDTGLENGGGEVQRRPPYGISEPLKKVLAAIKTE